MADLDANQLWDLFAEARVEYGEQSDEMRAVRDELIERHRPLVQLIALRLHKTLPKSVQVDDLISAGLFGLFDAINKFDPSRGVKFKTYCPPRIKGSILDQLRSEDWVPRQARAKAGRIQEATKDLAGRFGREPTHAELAAALDMEGAELTREFEAGNVKRMFSFSDKWKDGEDAHEPYDLPEDERASQSIADLDQEDLLNHLTRRLTQKERYILRQYYFVGSTMREIGELLSVTEGRICQIHKNIIDRLKAQMAPLQATLLS